MNITKNIKQFFKPETSGGVQLSRKKKVLLILFTLSFFSCILFAARLYVTEDFYYGFLVWNLFLAWLPFWFALWAQRLYSLKRKWWRIAIPFFLWFIFLPNAPYLITDLVHLRTPSEAPMWYDSLLIFSFAMTGLLIGVASLFIIHRMIQIRIGIIMSWLTLFFIFIAAGFGIYVGRILRWNSWDLIINTFPLFSDMSDHIMTKTSIAMTATFSGFIALSYLLIYFLVKLPERSRGLI